MKAIWEKDAAHYQAIKVMLKGQPCLAKFHEVASLLPLRKEQPLGITQKKKKSIVDKVSGVLPVAAIEW